jgi:hypothetical protein
LAARELDLALWDNSKTGKGSSVDLPLAVKNGDAA